MIETYLDESGVHDGATICVIAGYWGRPGAWEKCEVRWRRILASAGVPIEKFHALDLIEHRKFFFEMPRDKHQKLINDLAKAASSFRIYPVSQGVIVADFKALSHPQKRFFTGATIDDRRKPGKLATPGNPEKPYFMPFLQCVRRVLDYAPAGGKTHFYFGLDRPFFSYAVEMFKMIQNQPAKPHSAALGNTALLQAKETPQLQVADFLCYATYKHMLARHAANDWSVVPAEPLLTLLENMRQREDCIFYNHEVMAESLQISYEKVGNWDGHVTK